MEIQVTNLNEHERELLINAPWAMIEDEYNDLLKRYAALPVKGFRPGKTPRSAIESFYRQQLKGDLLSLVSTRLCRRALTEKNLTAGTPIEITESKMKPYEWLQFKATFIEMPAFTLPDYRHLHLEATEPEAQINEVSAGLLAATPIDLPEVFVAHELRYTELEGDTPTPQETADARERVKLMLILKRIAAQDSIELTTPEIEKRTLDMADEMETTPEELKEYLVANNSWERFVDMFLAEKVLQYIIDTQE